MQKELDLSIAAKKTFSSSSESKQMEEIKKKNS